MVYKFRKRFEDISRPFAHVFHNGRNYLNGHCFVSLLLCALIWNKEKEVYLSALLVYCMCQKSRVKPELLAVMVRQIMLKFHDKKNVIILCESWHVKKNLVSLVYVLSQMSL